MPLIPFPNVPNVPGVPAIPRSSALPPVVQSILGAAQGALWTALQTDTRWGIYDSAGKPLANPSNLSGLTSVLAGSVGIGSTLSTHSVGYNKEVVSSSCPIERGSFANYNKVESPGQATVTFAFAGSEAERSQFLIAIDTASKSTELYSVVTPEVQYIDYSLDNYSYRREARQGATLLLVELALSEIRQVFAQFTNPGQAQSPTSPDAAPTVSAGRVQPLNPVQSVIYSVQKKITGLL